MTHHSLTLQKGKINGLAQSHVAAEWQPPILTQSSGAVTIHHATYVHMANVGLSAGAQGLNEKMRQRTAEQT